MRAHRTLEDAKHGARALAYDVGCQAVVISYQTRVGFHYLSMSARRARIAGLDDRVDFLVNPITTGAPA